MELHIPYLLLLLIKKGYSDVSNISIVKPFEFLGKEAKLSDSGELLLKIVVCYKLKEIL